MYVCVCVCLRVFLLSLWRQVGAKLSSLLNPTFSFAVQLSNHCRQLVKRSPVGNLSHLVENLKAMLAQLSVYLDMVQISTIATVRKQDDEARGVCTTRTPRSTLATCT